jgi:hypothetical protein
MRQDNLDHLAKIADFQQTFKTENGRNVLRELMRISGFLQTSFVQGDPYTAAFNEGQRAIVIEILKKLKVDIKKLEQELMEDPERGEDAFI